MDPLLSSANPHVLRPSKKRKNSTDDYDSVYQRPSKRHGSDSSSVSSIASPIESICSSSPFSDIVLSSESESKVFIDNDSSENKSTLPGINSKTYIILSSTTSSPDEAATGRDDTSNSEKSPVESCANSDSSSKLTNNSNSNLSKNSNRKTRETNEANQEEEEEEEVVASSAAPSEDGSEDFFVAEFDIPDFVVSPTDIMSPEEPSMGPIDPAWVNRGEKTPHSTRKPLVYKTIVEEKPQCYLTPITEQRTCPLPKLDWVNANDMWKNMYRRDERASLERDSNMFANHSGLQPRMRAILLDWIIEVCEVYKLHRETYYLTVDYLDRYLTAKRDVSKNQLQLIGITCLFIASKVEEIYPPKLAGFAYVADGACSEEDILHQEILVLQALNWNVSPVTIMGWLSIYMQLNVISTKSTNTSTSAQQKQEILLNSDKLGKAFIYPQFSGLNYARTAQLIDLCSLDSDIADFPYSIVAAAAVSHTFDKNTALEVSGLDWATISPCAKWMEPYYQVIEEDHEKNPLVIAEANEQTPLAYGLKHICPNITKDDSHIIQTHTTSMDLFDKGLLRREQLESTEALIQQEASPAQQVVVTCPEGILTPPASNRKSL